MKRIKAGLSSRALSGFLWIVVILAAVASLYGGAQVLSGLDPFLVERIIVEKAEMASDRSIVRATGVVEGQKLFSVDVKKVRDRVTDLPWVRSAEVVRRIPDSVTVSVTEWEPAYLVRLNRLYYMTNAVEVIPVPLDAGLDFPIVTGVGWSELEAPGIVRDKLSELLTLIDQGYFGGPLSEIHVDPPGERFTLYGDNPHAHEVVMRFEGLEENLRRLARLKRGLDARGQTPVTVDLTFSGRIIARLSDDAGRGKRR